MFLTVPTLLTWARIVAIPLIVGVYYLPLDGATRNLAATVMFVFFALTDWLDGWLARKLDQASAFGAFLDPVADKFLICAALIVLLKLDRVDALVALIIIGREIAISALREWMAQIGASRSVAVHMLGKLKTTSQMVAIPFLLYDGALFGVVDTRIWGTVLMIVAAVLTVWSMIYYLRRAIPVLRAKIRWAGVACRCRRCSGRAGGSGAVSAGVQCAGPRDAIAPRAFAAGGDAGGVRAHLEHRLRRRTLRHAARAAAEVPGLALCLVGPCVPLLGVGLARAMAA